MNIAGLKKTVQSLRELSDTTLLDKEYLKGNVKIVDALESEARAVLAHIDEMKESSIPQSRISPSEPKATALSVTHIFSNENCDRFFNLVPLAIARVSLEGKIEWCNFAFAAMLGYKKDDITAHTFSSITHPDDLNTSRKMFKEMIEGKRLFIDIQKRYLTREGAIVYGQLSAVLVRDEDGTPRNAMAFIQDISELENQKQLIFDARSFDEMIFESSSVGIMTYNANGTCVSANSKAASILGGNLEDILKQNFNEIESWKKSGLYRAAINTLETASVNNLTINVTTPENRDVWIECYLSRFESKGTNHLLVLITDVSAKKAAEQERDRFFNISLNMLCTATLDGYFRQLNPSWGRTLGYSLEELTSKQFLEYVHPDDIKETKEKITLLGSGRNVINFVNRYRCKDGSYRWLNWISTPYKDLIYASALDITDLMNREAELEEALKALEISNKELEQFAYVASHDLQEPLRVIVSYLQFLEKLYKESLDEKGQDFINRTINATRRLQSMIQSLLLYSRLTTKKKQFSNCSTRDILDAVQENMQHRIAETKTELLFGNLPEVYGDRAQLERLFQNLISNSIKFCPDKKPRIEIEAGPLSSENTYTFAVRDNGIGISPEFHERIFEIFQRLHSRTEFEGTGIGLSACKKIVERHGGTISISSEEGAGSTFYFTLPGPNQTENDQEV